MMRVKIRIQPLGEVDEDLLNLLENELSKRFGDVIILKPIEMPIRCYNPIRAQYNSTCILKKLNAKRITLGVSEEDIYANGLNFVFGEAEVNGSRAIVSTYRLRFNADEELLKKRLIKEAIHEIGHVLGLGHCSNRRCVMCFSNSIFDVDEKSDEFCEMCSSYMENLSF